jgi:hypothetical protein
MRILLISAGLLASIGAVQAQDLFKGRNSGSGLGYGTGSNPNSHTTQGYTAPSGTYVQPHHQTNPNNTQLDNYGTRGNVNPYNGNVGTRSPYR